MKVFLTGATGILGTDIAGQLQWAGHEVLGFNSANIDISNYADVKQKVKDYKPDLIIHSAAMTNVDLCEDDKNAAIKINVIGSQNMSRAAALVNSKIVYISSCGVYGSGKNTPFNELDLPKPQTYHHYTKLEGELRTKEHNDNFLIIRPGWLFGGTVQHRKNFVEARRKEATSANVIKSAVDKLGSPTYTLDLAKQLIALINADMGGTFNAVNEGAASRFEYVAEIVKDFQLPTTIEQVNSNEFPRKAKMPDNEVLENMFLNLHNINFMRPWQDALKDYISSTYY